MNANPRKLTQNPLPPSCAALAVLLLVASGCATQKTAGYVSPYPSAFSAPPVEAPASTVAKTTFTEVPDEYRSKKWGLSDVLDLALSNNPALKSAWLDAKSAAARVGVAEAALYPKVNVDGAAGYKYLKRDDTDITTRQLSYGPSVSLSMMVLDFGGRDSTTKNALQTLAAASWSHSKLLQDTVLATQRAYYLYFATKAVRDARVKALERAELAQKTAEGRHEAGVATIADVLSAKTAVSQARLALDTVEGAIETTRGNLAVAMGFSATVKFDLADAPDDGPYEAAVADVEALISEALAKRPDLLASRMQAEAAKTLVRKAESDGMPTLNLVANTGMSWINLNSEAESPTNRDRREDSWFAGLTLTVPVFNGFLTTYSVEKAKFDAESAGERAKAADQLAVSQVFTAFHALKTASRRVKTADDLIKSAEASEEVAMGRYREGVGTMLDLVTAQTSLTDARTQAVSARWEWKTALAQLAHDTGKLEMAGFKTGGGAGR